MVLPKTCDYCRWERGRRVPATVNTGKDYIDSDGHAANPLMLCGDCAEVDRQMELRSDIDRRHRTEGNNTAP